MTHAPDHEPKWARSVMKSGEVWHICTRCGARRHPARTAQLTLGL